MERKTITAARRAITLALAALCWVVTKPASAHAAGANESWVTTWATAPTAHDFWRPQPAMVDCTLRQIVHTSVAGKQFRVRLTNEFGTQPLQIDIANVAISSGTSNIKAETLHTLAFGGRRSIVIPPGALAVSDPVDMALPALTDLAVSMYIPLQRINVLTAHGGANQDNYIQTGNSVSSASLASPVTLPSWFFLKGVEVLASDAKAGTIVAFGDSITDGAVARTNLNERWPDKLAARLQANHATATMGVANLGIGGNCVLSSCGGAPALTRFDRDVLAQPGVKYAIVLEGINDIGQLHTPNQPDYKLTAEDLEQGLSQLAVRAHERGIRIFGATITPYEGAGYFTEQGETVRETVNEWIRTSGAFDGVVDFDKAVRDPANPRHMLSEFDSGDHLHPKGDGLAAMANAIPLDLFR